MKVVSLAGASRIATPVTLAGQQASAPASHAYRA